MHGQASQRDDAIDGLGDESQERRDIGAIEFDPLNVIFIDAFN